MEQQEQSQEMIALNVLAKAAEKYLATLDDVARGPTQQYLQNAISYLVNVLSPTQEPVSDATPETEAPVEKPAKGK